MPDLKISILIPAYNAAKYIADAITSALCQTWQHIEVIVVDDGSTDNTLAVAESFQDARIKIIRQSNLGAAAARNTAFKSASGEYIQYLDADDLLAKDKLEEQMKMVQKWGNEYAYASSWGLFYDTVEQAVSNPTVLWQDYDNPVEWLTEAWTQQVWMQPGAWLTPRSMIEKAGEWDESLSLHDDGEFFCRVLLQSKGIKFCEQAKSYYRKGIDDSLSSTFSEKAIKSHLKICELYEEYLLTVENTIRTRQACAINYMHFHFAHYPDYKVLRQQALQAAKRLGGAEVQLQGTELFHMLKRLMGWRIARKMEKFYYGNGLNKTAIKKRLIRSLCKNYAYQNS